MNKLKKDVNGGHFDRCHLSGNLAHHVLAAIYCARSGGLSSFKRYNGLLAQQRLLRRIIECLQHRKSAGGSHLSDRRFGRNENWTATGGHGLRLCNLSDVHGERAIRDATRER